MSDERAKQLAFLRQQRDAAPDAASRAMYDGLLASLEALPAHEVRTEGGDYAEGSLDKRMGTFIEGHQYQLHFSGAQFLDGLALLAGNPADYGAALRRYLTHLYREYAGLDLRGIDDRPLDMPLSELYVSLNLHEPPPADLAGRGALRGFMAKVGRFFQVGQGEVDVGDVAGRPESVDWTQALRHPRLAVVGAPGSGKTTLLHYTAVRLAEVLARDDAPQLAALGLAATGSTTPPVPLLLPLRELGSFLHECNGKELAGVGPRLLLECLTNYYARFDLALPADFFARLCEAGRALLLLDGLDEVASTADRALVSSIVRTFVGRYQRCRYVITSRVAAYQGDAQLGAGFRICTVADLDATQQQRFIGNWSRSLHRLLYQVDGPELARRAGRYADELWQALELNERVAGLASNPLLLTVVAVIFYNNYVLPEDRAALYEECVEVLLRGGRGKADRPGQQRREYAGRPELTMGLDPKREILAAVAYRMHQRGEAGLFIERDELVREVAAVLHGRYATPAELAKSFVDELPVHIGLLDEREPDRYRFSHLSFQEFLAARHIAEAPDERWGELLDRYQDTWWREVILLCAGHLSQERCWRFLSLLCARGDTPAERVSALALASDALTELERFKGQGSLSATIQADAHHILERQPATAVPARARVQCGRILARLGDPRPGVGTLPPAMLELPGGSVMLGVTAAERAQLPSNRQSWFADAQNEVEVPVPGFAIGRYPVTNAQYAEFIAAGGYDPAAPWWDAAGRAWLARDDAATEGLEPWQRRQRKDQPEEWDDEAFGHGRGNSPVVGVNWYEAMAFGRWLTASLNDGFVYRLPSEAEWEYAARGPTRRNYPWGAAEPEGEQANFDQIYRGTTAVGCFPSGATRDGVLDLAGNVWEWTRSVYRPYPYNPDLDNGREEGADAVKKRFTLRGGSWNDVSFLLRAANRYHVTPDYHDRNVGFRLARHPHV
ncbi:SUMF1/EgtB/PvdO family nonheme iron enzyme [Candidatus Chloroploca sp. M-50]|uniref:SUMF1/EgtB/PvdO family nonheme iron enzyme n=1 Tax=Candidatus Chloroploca mongolica TaxID=2528176 RepID=A0ABS4DFL2_9CHLR|nr:SUMF1/EgtB/PvdO family nonheme iron enzyme [Candidatus Chloroploca mongolica]MBP1468210.1 SUMF1/EgtB/PvdO family nonheme iron enzyme [Candidatus Chloroploca mongolica]